jgi:hypothetical protein
VRRDQSYSTCTITASLPLRTLNWTSRISLGCFAELSEAIRDKPCVSDCVHEGFAVEVIRIDKPGSEIHESNADCATCLSLRACDQMQQVHHIAAWSLYPRSRRLTRSPGSRSCRAAFAQQRSGPSVNPATRNPSGVNSFPFNRRMLPRHLAAFAKNKSAVELNGLRV